jgi:hypothetical protein
MQAKVSKAQQAFNNISTRTFLTSWKKRSLKRYLQPKPPGIDHPIDQSDLFELDFKNMWEISRVDVLEFVRTHRSTRPVDTWVLVIYAALTVKLEEVESENVLVKRAKVNN